MRVRLGFLCVAFALTGCSDCDKCQSAIDHLAGKLREQGCDPSTTQNAVERIDEDCKNVNDGNDNRLFIGTMVEACQASPATAIGASCPAPGSALVFGVEFVNLDPDGAELSMLLRYDDAASASSVGTGALASGATTRVEVEVEEDRASLLQLEVQDAEGNVVHSQNISEHTLTVRQDSQQWSPFLVRRIVYQGPESIRFENFEDSD